MLPVMWENCCCIGAADGIMLVRISLNGPLSAGQEIYREKRRDSELEATL